MGYRQLRVAELQRSYLSIVPDCAVRVVAKHGAVNSLPVTISASVLDRSHFLELIARGVKCGVLNSTPISCQLFPEAVA